MHDDATLERNRWQHTLDAACASTAQFQRAIVLQETPSTQDAAETRAAARGTIVTTLRQTAGRGRLGRSWADTASDGLAATFVIAPQAPERLVLASAVAAARAVERSLGTRVGIKWPNDIAVRGRKLAGVLAEVRGDVVALGIGINISQRGFDGELAARATSLAMLGREVDRLQVLSDLVATLDESLAAADGTLIDEYLLRDALAGTHARFATPAGLVEGKVRTVDPMRGLVVRTELGEVFLSAQTTSVVEWHADGRGVV